MKIMSNQTSSPLKLERKDGGSLTIPPLGEMRIENKELEDEFKLDEIKIMEKDRVLDVKDRDRLTPLMAAIGIDFWWLILGLILGLTVKAFRESHLYWAVFVAGFFFIPLLGALLSRGKEKKRPLMPIVNQYLSLLIVLGIGCGMPAAIIYLFGNGTTLLNPSDMEIFSFGLLVRISQLLLIMIASLLPALLFFLFDRQLMSTLRLEFYHQVMHLSPDFKTIDDVKARYQNRVEEIYGNENEIGGRLLNDTRIPILVGTLLISIGWVLTLPVIDTFSNPDGDLGLSLLNLLMPLPSPLSYAFLGAYFFGLNMVFRRYVRSDLRPKAYSHISVRILVTLILVWFLMAVIKKTDLKEPEWILIAMAFFIGILPETWLVFVQEYIKIGGGVIRRLSGQAGGFEEEHPLTKLEGINLYHRARLMEEGIENIENLAHHDLVDLILRTRIPVQVLIDWVDQAILYMHTYSSCTEDKQSSQKILQRYGIRTATDLMQALRLSKERDARMLAEGKAAVEEENLLQIIPSPDGKARPLQVIIDALEDDEWLKCILYWRSRNVLL